MAIACLVDLDTARLRHEIQAIYARVAADPSGAFHFHRGPAYAAEVLGYDATALAALPPEATASFAGVANPHRIAALPPGRRSWTSGAAPAWTFYWRRAPSDRTARR